MAGAIDAAPPGPRELALVRLTVEFLRPVPLAPLAMALEVVRPGRRAQLVQASLTAEGREVARATGLRLARVPEATGDPVGAAPTTVPGPESARPVSFTLSGRSEPSFAGQAMEMRFVDGGARPGPATVWMRLAVDLVEGEPTPPVARAAATADFGNGVGAALDFERHVFVNADLSLYLHRPPAGEWVCLAGAHTEIARGEGAVAYSDLHDERGPIGRAAQGLVVGVR